MTAGIRIPAARGRFQTWGQPALITRQLQAGKMSGPSCARPHQLAADPGHLRGRRLLGHHRIRHRASRPALHRDPNSSNITTVFTLRPCTDLQRMPARDSPRGEHGLEVVVCPVGPETAKKCR